MLTSSPYEGIDLGDGDDGEDEAINVEHLEGKEEGDHNEELSDPRIVYGPGAASIFRGYFFLLSHSSFFFVLLCCHLLDS